MSISAENLCVLEKGSNITLKITDFGSAKKEMEPPNFMGFTMGYQSPELGIQLVKSKYQSSIPNRLSFDTADYVMTTKSDIYSFAMLTVSLWCSFLIALLFTVVFILCCVLFIRSCQCLCVDNKSNLIYILFSQIKETSVCAD